MTYPTQAATLAQTGPSEAAGQLASATAAAEVAFDLTAWAGRWVQLTVETTDTYYLLAGDAGAQINPTATQLDAGSADAEIPDFVQEGSFAQFVVDPDEPFLIVRTGGAAGFVRVRLAQPG